MRSVGSRNQATKFASEERPVTDSVAAADGDFVKLASGRVTTASIASGKLYGVVQGGENSNLVSRNYRTPSTTGDSAGTKTVLVELCEGQIYELPVSASLAADAEGSYYKLTGASGAQTVDNTTKDNDAGQLLCIKRIPTNAAGTQFLKGHFVVADPVSNTNDTVA